MNRHIKSEYNTTFLKDLELYKHYRVSTLTVLKEKLSVKNFVDEKQLKELGIKINE